MPPKDETKLWVVEEMRDRLARIRRYREIYGTDIAAATALGIRPQYFSTLKRRLEKWEAGSIARANELKARLG